MVSTLSDVAFRAVANREGFLNRMDNRLKRQETAVRAHEQLTKHRAELEVNHLVFSMYLD